MLKFSYRIANKKKNIQVYSPFFLLQIFILNKKKRFLFLPWWVYFASTEQVFEWNKEFQGRWKYITSLRVGGAEINPAWREVLFWFSVKYSILLQAFISLCSQSCNKVLNVMSEANVVIFRRFLIRAEGGRGVLSYICYVGICQHEGYGFQAVKSGLGYRNHIVLV